MRGWMHATPDGHREHLECVGIMGLILHGNWIAPTEDALRLGTIKANVLRSKSWTEKVYFSQIHVHSQLHVQCHEMSSVSLKPKSKNFLEKYLEGGSLVPEMYLTGVEEVYLGNEFAEAIQVPYFAAGAF
ncbi:hypothetical protein CEXT_144171 [Caerostris extrusa]|uniref:Uncharacterized protein n=1 Tax=Caerostris extrusa TaxID=172846 RepID=A0AAV4MQE6_CAEEX|nr:hypothetical protein CEXT_144171 [Caerostris extrusa]